MENLELFNLLQTLTKKEMSKATAYLSSFTPASEQCLQLFKIIEQSYKNAKYDWAKVDLTKELLNKKMFGVEKDDKRTRTLRSRLTKNLKRYCRFIAFDREQEESNYLLEYFLEKNTYKLFDAEYRKICKNLERQSGIQVVKQSYEIFELKTNLLAKQFIQEGPPDYQQSFEQFFDFSLLKQMQIYCLMLNRNLIASFDFEEDMEKNMQGIFELAIKRHNLQLLPQFYWTCSEMLKGDKKQYHVLKKMLLENAETISINDLRLLYIFMHTFCINSQDAKLLKEAREDYSYRFEKKLLHEGEFLPVMHAKNLSTRTAVKARDRLLTREEAEIKLEKIAKEMEPAYRKSTLDFHLGLLDYYYKNYDAAIQLLQKNRKYANDFFKFDARTVVIRAYLLKDEWDVDALDKAIRNFRNALKKVKDFSEEHKVSYRNFMIASEKLYKAKLLPRSERKKAVEELNAFLEGHRVTVKGWFLEQIKTIVV